MREHACYRTVCGFDACLLSCHCGTDSSTILDLAGLIRHGFTRHRVAAAVAAALAQVGPSRSRRGAQVVPRRARRVSLKPWRAALLAGTCLAPIGASGQTWVGATGD